MCLNVFLSMLNAPAMEFNWAEPVLDSDMSFSKALQGRAPCH